MKYKLDHDYAKYYEFPKSDFIIDLGATVGEFEIIYKDKILSNDIHVICVEPERSSFLKLCENLKGFPKSTVFNFGIWKENTELNFTTTDNPWCNMFDITGHDVSMIAKTIEKTTYTVKSLDYILDSVEEVGFLKADIEGAEIEAFTNCSQLNKIKHLAIASYHEVDGKKTWETLRPFFHSKGYYTSLEDIPFNGYPSYTMLYAWKG